MAGNLCLLRLSADEPDRDFPSDLGLVLEAAGAKVTVLAGSEKKKRILTPAEFVLERDLGGKGMVVAKITFPVLTKEHVFRYLSPSP